MDKLIAVLKRLYFLEEQQCYRRKSGDHAEQICSAEGESVPAIVAGILTGDQSVSLELVGPNGMVRAMAASFEKAGDWEDVARLYQAIQDELDLPAPAISISGHGGYTLWFSLTEAISAPLATAFLEALRLKYLAEMPLSSLTFHPDAKGPNLLPLAPALDETTGKWSAFIDPSMGGMFVDEPGLEMAPNMGRQADMLERLESIKPADLMRATEVMQASDNADSNEPEALPAVDGSDSSKQLPGLRPACQSLASGKYYTDPRDFLLAVMNDPSASAKKRIKAANALLPYVSETGSEQNLE